MVLANIVAGFTQKFVDAKHVCMGQRKVCNNAKQLLIVFVQRKKPVNAKKLLAIRYTSVIKCISYFSACSCHPDIKPSTANVLTLAGARIPEAREWWVIPWDTVFLQCR
jgi:hypothetical protein